MKKNTFEGEIWHLLFVVGALFLLNHIMQSSPLLLHHGELWGVTTDTWFWAGVILAIVHQVYITFAWRLELHHKLLTKTFGPKAFNVYASFFALLGLSRITLVILLAISNYRTFYMPPMLRWGTVTLFVTLALFTIYSVARYFTFRRAMGLDHFDPSVAKMGLVKKGAFAIVPNAMYTFGLLMPFAIAIAAKSKATLLLAFFIYAYIWVHYYCTEKPDMKRIYG